ncbi:MAG: translation elongation factor Ts [Clostridiaceae bacterium]|jgi:elongation factor Ts|nr:translation elongation factor Ts [Clostridiaceae bacterium]
MAFTAKDVVTLREKTGVGMMDCKKALVEADGDMDKAVEILREKGLASAAKKSSRVAAEGTVATYNDGKAASLVEINCETDFVAKGEPFVNLANSIAKTIVEANPADVDALLASKIADGEGTVEEAVQEVFLALRENMKVRRFERIDGHVVSYIHGGGTVGVLVAFDTDDATAAKPEFIAMGKDVAMQIAAMSPEYLSKDDITADEAAKMRNITVESALNKPESLPKPILKSLIEKACANKEWSDEDIAIYNEKGMNNFLFNFLSEEAPAVLAKLAIADKAEIVANKIFGGLVEGRIAKQIKETCLLEQAFVKDGDMTVAKYVASVAKELGADIKVTKFVRFAKGEGIEKKQEDFAAEIANMVK